VVDRGIDLPLAWSGGGSSVVEVLLMTSRTLAGSPAHGVFVTCDALASSGAMAIPAAALAKLEPTSADVSGFVTVAAHHDASVIAGGRTILLRATSTATGGVFDTLH
jgi:hypothetical protein